MDMDTFYSVFADSDTHSGYLFEPRYTAEEIQRQKEEVQQAQAEAAPALAVQEDTATSDDNPESCRELTATGDANRNWVLVLPRISVWIVFVEHYCWLLSWWSHSVPYNAPELCSSLRQQCSGDFCQDPKDKLDKTTETS